jgi:hypothetical protein
MGIETLARLLEETAAEVPAPAMAEAVWHRARRIRQRRRIVAGVATAAVICGVAVGTAIAVGAAPWAAPPPVGGTPNITQTPSPSVVDKLPGRLGSRDGLPLPRTLQLTTRGVKSVTERPLSRAVALYQQDPGQTLKLSPIFVLGSDGAVRGLDAAVKLDFTRDAEGHTISPVLATSLSPDGRRAAFPQRDGLTIVDLPTGKPDVIALPGWNGYVLWHGNSTVLVGQARAAFAVDLTSRTPKALPSTFAVRDVAVDPEATHPVVDLPSGAGPLAVRERVGYAARPQSEIRVDQSRLDGYRVNGWQGPAWRSGDLVVRAGAGTGPDSRGTDLVGVVETRTGAVVRLLATAATPLGWLDGRTVLLATARQGIVAWDIRSGQVTSVSSPFDGTVAIPPQ